MSPSKTTVKPITPSSVKGLMIVEAAILAFLGVWLDNEYMNNVYMQLYVNNVIGEHLTTYTMIFGLTIGLAGTATAITLWKSLREVKYKLERLPSPRLKGGVRQALAALPTIDEELPNPRQIARQAEAPATSTSTIPQNTAPGPAEPQQAPAPVVPPAPVQTVPPPSLPSQDRQDTRP